MINRLRLCSGLILFTFLVGHLTNHALGIVSLEAMNAGLPFTIGPWRTLPGTVLFCGAALVHVGVALWSLYMRQTLRMPAWHVTQVTLGLLIPLVLIGHAVGTRGLHEVFGVHGNYTTELAALWLLLPAAGVLQPLLLIVAWVHACIGLHAWLRLKPWYAAHDRLALALAVLWPALALAGYVSSGMQVVRQAAAAGWLEDISKKAGMSLDMIDWVERWSNEGATAFVLLVALVFAARALRLRHSERAG